eukprot:753636-Hanusia_phi.AAC.4
MDKRRNEVRHTPGRYELQVPLASSLPPPSQSLCAPLQMSAPTTILNGVDGFPAKNDSASFSGVMCGDFGGYTGSSANCLAAQHLHLQTIHSSF